jgi:hypothetical protein
VGLLSAGEETVFSITYRPRSPFAEVWLPSAELSTSVIRERFLSLRKRHLLTWRFRIFPLAKRTHFKGKVQVPGYYS